MFTHIAVVRDLVDTQYKEYQEVRIPNHNDGSFHVAGVGQDSVSPDTFLPILRISCGNCIHC